MSLVIVGNTVKLTPNASATANVANVAVKTNTFHVTNASSNVYAYVGVFGVYADAVNMTYPNVSSPGGGTILVPNESMTISGNFGPALMSTQANVFIAAITASGTTSVFFTPVAPGSN
jgi:hypothetical protein